MGGLVWAAIGFAGAAFGAEYLLPSAGLPYYAAALAFMSLLTPLLRKKYRRAALTLSLSAAAGLLAWWGTYELCVLPCEALAGQDITVTARVTDYPRVTEKYARVPVTVTEGAPRVRGYLYLYGGELGALEPGDVVEAEIRVSSAVLRSGERAHYYTAEGRYLIGYLREPPALTGRAGRAWLYFPQRWRHGIAGLCERLFPADTGLFMKALLVGDRDELYGEPVLYESMRSAGVLHIVAVSGMHLHVLMMYVYALFGRGRRTSLMCMPLLLLFVLMTGCGASVVRAAVMQLLLLAAPFFGREHDWPSAMAAALLLLMRTPMAVGGVGLQLSFACTLGFAVFMPRLEPWLAARGGFWETRPGRYILQSLAASFCATVFSVPVAAYYFGAVPLLSPVTNLLTLFAVELCFGVGFVVCILGAVLPALGSAPAWALSWAARWCLAVYRLAGRLPFACLYTAEPAAAVWLVLVYAVFIGWAVLRRYGRQRSVLIPSAVCAAALLGVFLASAARLALGRREFTVLDVGQGECAVLFDRDGAVVLDCGGTENAGELAADYLLSAGKRYVDAVVLSHLHEDHTNGVETLLARLPVGALILPSDAEDTDGMLDGILAAAEHAGTEVVFLTEESEADLGALTLTLLLPNAGEDENERGIVTLAAYPDASVLFMGDGGFEAENALLARGLVPDTDILAVGHHGSKSASGAEFLAAAGPALAVISVGYNGYGQPSENTLSRLEAYCGAVYRTDLDGTVTISLR